MSWIDAHCHLSDIRLSSALPGLLKQCEAEGIRQFILGGVDPDDWNRQSDLDRHYPGKFLKVFGFHPWAVHDLAMQSAPGQAVGSIERILQKLEPLLNDCVALGETGLDAARSRLKGSRAEQLFAFESQLALAKTRHKPLVLHVVRAHPTALDILAAHKPSQGGIVHSYSGTWAEARKYLDLGLTLSISARITHPDAHDLHETVSRAPADRLVFETDAPDQPPHGAASKLHTPLSLLRVVDKVSELRGEQAEAWLDRSRDNLQRIFNI
jgi:TatD DNase family protein